MSKYAEFIHNFTGFHALGLALGVCLLAGILSLIHHIATRKEWDE